MRPAGEPTTRLDAAIADYRQALVQRRYNHTLESAYRIANLACEIAIGLGALASLVAGLAAAGPGGRNLWLAISAATALLALIKPVLGLPGRAMRHALLYDGYRTVSIRLAGLVEQLRDAASEVPPGETERGLTRARQRLLELEDEATPPGARLARRISAQIDREIEATARRRRGDAA
jgi:hypothetical protein